MWQNTENNVCIKTLSRGDCEALVEKEQMGFLCARRILGATLLYFFQGVSNVEYYYFQQFLSPSIYLKMCIRIDTPCIFSIIVHTQIF